MARRRRLSITLLIAIIVVSPILVVSAVLVGLGWSSSSHISENLGEEILSQASIRVEAQVREYLGDAIHVSDRYAGRVKAGVLPDPPGEAWERTMLDDLVTSPSVASICYGNLAGDTTWLLRRAQHLEIGRVNGPGGNRTLEYEIDPATGRIVEPPLRKYVYVANSRPWWKAAMASDVPVWTPVYLWFAGNGSNTSIGTGYSRKIYDHAGKLRGALVIDVTLGALSEFLRGLEISQRGEVFIVDPDNRLVAASQGAVTDAAGNALTFASLHLGGLRGERLTLDAVSGGEASRGHVTTLKPYPGINWRIVAIFPESAFLGEAQRLRLRALIAGAAAVVGSLVLGLILARYLSRPLVMMTEHVKRVGAGDFEQRLHLHAAQELAILSHEINRMTEGLRQRMALEQSLAVAMEVQQSLLPAGDPKLAGLDVAGRSQYCDETGGDYYDFIEISRLSESSLMIAVGDVMGHGIAAALLMATARAALRSRAPDRPGLGALMTRANFVLSANNGHNRFMTLSILEIDAASRVVTWASAGHDPAIVYDPAEQSFAELDGGDIPLGIERATEYKQYQSNALAPGALLVVGTDGVWETVDDQNEQYGKERLRAIMQENHASPAARIAEILEADLAAFRKTKALKDDVTFVIVKFLEAAGSVLPGSEGAKIVG